MVGGRQPVERVLHREPRVEQVDCQVVDQIVIGEGAGTVFNGLQVEQQMMEKLLDVVHHCTPASHSSA